MAKYYVQSGTIRREDDSSKSSEIKSESAKRGGVKVLSGKVSVSQTGFDRDDAQRFPTLDVVADWNQMLTTLDRLERMLYRAA